MSFVVGFTGTRWGLIRPQREKMFELLCEPMDQFHHGDCIGADAWSHDQVLKRLDNVFIHVHPPTNPENRAWKHGHVTYEPKPYFDRNKDIVDMSEFMLAAPRGMSEELRSGTWHAIRYAIEQKKRVIIVWPNGKVEER